MIVWSGLFLENMMHKMGHLDLFISLILMGDLQLVLSHQKDLLSSYLFLICAEGFSDMFRKAEVRDDLHNVKIYR